MQENIAGYPVAATVLATMALLKPETATAGPDATNTSVEATMTILKIRWSTPDSVAPSLVSGRSHSKETIRAHPVWAEYFIDHVRSMAPPINLPIIPTKAVGFLNRPVS